MGIHYYAIQILTVVETVSMLTLLKTLLYEKLSGNENVRLIVGHGQNHVYPVYPTLEGRIAMEQIRNIMVR